MIFGRINGLMPAERVKDTTWSRNPKKRKPKVKKFCSCRTLASSLSRDYKKSKVQRTGRPWLKFEGRNSGRTTNSSHGQIVINAPFFAEAMFRFGRRYARERERSVSITTLLAASPAGARKGGARRTRPTRRSSMDGPFAESDIFQGECGQTPLLSFNAGRHGQSLYIFGATPVITWPSMT